MEPTMKVISQGPSQLLQIVVLSWQYVLTASVYPREAEILKELRDAIANHPHSIALGTVPDGAQFIALLLKLLNTEKTIEVSVFTRYSLLLRALTIQAYEIGLPFIKKVDDEHKIDFVLSQALPVLDKLQENHLDFAFVDANRANLKNYEAAEAGEGQGCDHVQQHSQGGTIASSDQSSVDPARQFAWKDTIKFDEMIAGDPWVDISQVVLGDGMTICRRIY
ncbi:hypothetical protein ACJRO7_016160 [Eucalyptus globulus]|uniref:Uncharacterized protein n=1 Tax=Eucalyptus globulus TaxID=34317 RepID=A0ABD3L719_EUCGL